MIAALLALSLAAPGFSAAERAALERISAAEISAHVRFLSSDLLTGRFPGTPGDELAIEYLATELEGIGFLPGATGPDGKPSWFQEVPLVEHTAAVPAQVVFERGRERRALPTGPGTSAQVVLHSLGDRDLVSLHRAGLVFAGYGIVAPEHGWDDYRGLDVKGKVVVVMNFNPPWAGKGVRLWYGRWDYKYLEAARHGAAGALVIHTDESAGYPWQVVTTSNGPTAFGLPPAGDPDPHLPFEGWIAHDAAARLFSWAGHDLDAAERAAAGAPHGFPLGIGATFDMPVTRRTVPSANVVGLLPGTDPALRAQAVLYSAHHDHLGERVPPVPGQHNVYSGALDNASGCAAVLTIARALHAAPPRRSVIVLFPTAEEQGLLGSRWYASHPTVRPGRLAADINLDGVNIHGLTTDVGFLDFGRTSADGVVEAVATAQGRTVHGDAYPDRGYPYRSDDFSLARVGVPALRLQGGPHYLGHDAAWGREQVERYEREHYHQTSDVYPPSPAAWELSGAVQDAQLQLVVGLRLGNQDELPQWRPGDEFEAARRAAER
ncbi:MAG: M28 family peptidase [Myxococcales bacterium]